MAMDRERGRLSKKGAPYPNLEAIEQDIFEAMALGSVIDKILFSSLDDHLERNQIEGALYVVGHLNAAIERIREKFDAIDHARASNSEGGEA